MEVILIIELKSCPFCGGEADIGVAWHPVGNIFVYCKEFKSATEAFEDDKYEGEKEVWIDGNPYYQKSLTAKQKAIIAWNRRNNL